MTVFQQNLGITRSKALQKLIFKVLCFISMTCQGKVCKFRAKFICEKQNMLSSFFSLFLLLVQYKSLDYQ